MSILRDSATASKRQLSDISKAQETWPLVLAERQRLLLTGMLRAFSSYDLADAEPTSMRMQQPSSSHGLTRERASVNVTEMDLDEASPARPHKRAALLLLPFASVQKLIRDSRASFRHDGDRLSLTNCSAASICARYDAS